MMKNVYNFDEKLVADEVQGDWYEQHHWADYFNAYRDKPQDLGLPALPPPKRFLKSGSVYWVSPDVKYTFGDSTKVPYSTRIAVRKYHNIDNETLRLLRLGYFFLRDKDCMSPTNKSYRSVVYNVEKKALYVIQATPKYKYNKKGMYSNKYSWSKEIRRVSLNSQPLGMVLGSFTLEHVDRFIDDLKDIVSKEIPDVCDICQNSPNRIIALILQHRVGRGIPNLNDAFINNLSMLVQHQFIGGRLDNILGDDAYRKSSMEEIEEYEKELKKLKRNSVYKFIPTLIETNSIKKALQVLLDECYVGIFTKVMFDIDWSEINFHNADFIIKYKESVPKALQHYVVRSLKTKSKQDFKILFENVLIMLRAYHVEDRIKDSWVRIIRRLNIVIPFNIWKDTYSMADDLNIRIRPNRFDSLTDVLELHDNLSRVMVRNRNIANPGLAIDGNSKFVELDYPEVFETYKFKQLLTAKELQDETAVMGHCVHSYDRSCIRGDSIIFSAIGPDERRWTVEYSGRGLHYVQAEGRKLDNGGARYFCPKEIYQEIFVPYAQVLSKYYKNPISYKLRSKVNFGIIKMKAKAFALDDITTLDIPNESSEIMDTGLDKCNCILEDLVSIKSYIKLNKLTIAESNVYIDSLLKKIDNPTTTHQRYRDRNLGRRIEARQVMMATPDGLFPQIPEEAVRAIQAAPDPFDVGEEEQQDDDEFPF